jgi:hypothetical protein
MYNLDDEFLEVVGTVQKNTRTRDSSAIDTTNDTFFLLSCFEVFGTGVKWSGFENYGVGEGKPYEYYIQRSQSNVPFLDSDTGRIKCVGTLIENKVSKYEIAHGWGLRSPYGQSSDWAVFKNGEIRTMNATAVSSSATFIAPACCIY